MLFFKFNEFDRIVLKKSKRKFTIHKRKISKIYNTFIIFLFIITLFYTIKIIDKRLLPSVIAITDKIMKRKINDSVSISVNKLIGEMNLKSSDFYIKSQDENCKVNYLSVNTVLISELCNKVSLDVSENLNTAESNKISIPLGTLMGIESLANTGPKYKVRVVPMGDIFIDYKTSFKSVGINQVNFQVWLDINSNIRIISPLQKADIELNRKISLVNTIITGEVPITYFNMENKKQ